jgi:hypothetical protein
MRVSRSTIPIYVRHCAKIAIDISFNEFKGHPRVVRVS